MIEYEVYVLESDSADEYGSPVRIRNSTDSKSSGNISMIEYEVSIMESDSADEDSADEDSADEESVDEFGSDSHNASSHAWQAVIGTQEVTHRNAPRAHLAHLPQLSHPMGATPSPTAEPSDSNSPANNSRIKRHRCVDCGKRFMYRSWLAQHRKVHTDEKPIECEVCEKRFKKKGDCNRHIINAHGRKR